MLSLFFLRIAEQAFAPLLVHLVVLLGPVNLFASPELPGGVDVFVSAAIDAGWTTLPRLAFFIGLHDKPAGFLAALFVRTEQGLLRLALGKLALQVFNLVCQGGVLVGHVGGEGFRLHGLLQKLFVAASDVLASLDSQVQRLD